MADIPDWAARTLGRPSASYSETGPRLPRRTVEALSLAAAYVVACLAADLLVFGEVLGTGHPQWSAYELLRTGLAAAVSVLIVGSIHADGRAARADARRLEMPLPPVALSLALAAAFVLLFLVSPPLFSRLGREDNVVEYASALLCLAGAAFYLGAFRAARRAVPGTPRRRVALWLAPLCAMVLFVLGMEEISWMQRIFGFETPDAFASNIQGETNLHNFATNSLVSVYQVGGWAALILLPYIIALGPRVPLLNAVHDFLPPAWLAVFAAPLAAFNYNVWLFPPIEIMAFSTILILAVYCMHAGRAKHHVARSAYAIAAVLVAVAQSVFLLGGDRFVRNWDVTEYQEFFIAFGLAAVAWSASHRVRSRSRESQPLVASHDATS